MGKKRKAVKTDNESPEVKRTRWEMHFVEEILDRRITDEGDYEYLIKWMYYDHTKNTWESRINLVRLFKFYSNNEFFSPLKW